MFDIIFLDLDDTIFDFGAAEANALEIVLRQFGLTATKELTQTYSRINDAHWKRLERGELTRREVQIGRFSAFFAEIGVDTNAEEANRIFMDAIAETVCFYDGAEQLLRELRTLGKRVYVVSNATRSVQLRRLEKARLLDFFDDVFLSEDIGSQKPSRLFFDRCFEMVPSMKLDRSIILGDSLTSDILGGINAGIATCWFNPKGKTAPDDIKPDFEIQRLSAFIDIVK
jgi:2-haloacid dehalogenase